MVELIVGKKGKGKTKVLLDKVNGAVKDANGSIVYLDKSTKHMYELNNKVRLIDVSGFPVKNADEFVGFICGTAGWQIREELDALRKTEPIDKETFGSTDLAGELTMIDEDEGIGSITLVGLCTDICVISNALLIKASLPEVPICVDATCCAGVTPESHENALKAMEACQIRIIR